MSWREYAKALTQKELYLKNQICKTKFSYPPYALVRQNIPLDSFGVQNWGTLPFFTKIALVSIFLRASGSASIVSYSL